MIRHRQPVVLISTLGRNPQVLCETIWSLANRDKPIVPDEIVAISMGNFAVEARESIFGVGGGWKSLLANLRKSKIKISEKLIFSDITIASDVRGEIHDLRTVEDNTRCANYLFRLLRKYTDGHCPTRIIFSLSGGRKSLSAIATSTMSLLARPEDELIHLITDPKFEDGAYHFPRAGRGYSLFEVPFVRTRGLISGVDIDKVETFAWCRELTQERIQGVSEYPKITLDAQKAAFIVSRRENSKVTDIDGSRFLFLWLLFKMKSLDSDRFIEIMCKAHSLSGLSGAPAWFRRFQKKVDKFLDATQCQSARDFSKVKHETMRDVVKMSGLTEMQALSLYPRMKNGKPIPFEYGIDYPADMLSIIDTPFTNHLAQLLMPVSS